MHVKQLRVALVSPWCAGLCVDGLSDRGQKLSDRGIDAYLLGVAARAEVANGRERVTAALSYAVRESTRWREYRGKRSAKGRCSAMCSKMAKRSRVGAGGDGTADAGLLKLCRSHSPSARLNDYQRSIGKSRTVESGRWFRGSAVDVNNLYPRRLFSHSTAIVQVYAEARQSPSAAEPCVEAEHAHLLISAVMS